MKFLSKLIICVAVAMACLTSCSRNSSAIQAMVDELNSPTFRAMEAKTGLFDDSKAEIDGDSLVITFLCRPWINLSGISQEQMPQLQASALAEFRDKLADENFRKGIEALAEEHMAIKMVWQDVNGQSIDIKVDPAEVLK